MALAAALVGLGWLGTAAELAPLPAAQLQGAPPPLELDEDAPLLLDEPAPAEAAVIDPKHPVADNTRCYVCHVNYKEEPFVQWHAKANIGCVRCHGDSPEHIADEANLTPPALMYWPSRVGFNCYGCHPQHKASPRDIVVRWQERIAGKVDPKRVLCTHCHGAHQLPLRTIIWDKRSRVLISKTSTNIPNRAPSPPPRTASPGGPLDLDTNSRKSASNEPVNSAN